MKLELRGITKRFPGVVANDSVDLTVEEGEVVALLGENGAGKSTLMNVLYGLYSADEGEIRIDDQPLTLGSPAESIAAGIGMVHQHFMLVPVFTVAENVILGIEPTNGLGVIKQREAEQRVRDLSTQFGFDIDPHALVENLPIGVQQRVEIIKVLLRDARFLVLDEPTAVLTPQEVDDLFEIIGQLRQAGKGIVFISHKLKEALTIADRIVVMRQGKTVAEVDPAYDHRAGSRHADGRPPGRTGGPQGAGHTGRAGRPGRTSPGVRRPQPTRCRRREHDRSEPARSSASPGCRATARPNSSRRSPACAPRCPAASCSRERT